MQQNIIYKTETHVLVLNYKMKELLESIPIIDKDELQCEEKL